MQPLPQPEVVDEPGFLPPQPPPERPRRNLPALLVAVLLVAATVTATWAFGGFGEASGRLIRLEPNTPVDLGPMTISLHRAMVRQNSGDDHTVYVFGHCNNTSDEPLSSSANRFTRSAFAALHPITREVASNASLFFGPGETIGDSTVINPGTPPVPCTLVFDFEAFPGVDHISVGASAVEWIDVSPTGEGHLAWSTARTGYRFDLPLVTRPDEP